VDGTGVRVSRRVTQQVSATAKNAWYMAQLLRWCPLPEHGHLLWSTQREPLTTECWANYLIFAIGLLSLCSRCAN
jgi:hypothetical protein